MREYIHFFENSDLRDAYEYGSDYTEPYVSYTPVINEYKAQLNGESTLFTVTKQRNSYLISSNSNTTQIINEEEFGEKPIVNSNIFYISRLSTGLDVIRSPRTAYIYVFPEDLELTEESTEFTFNGVTYGIESIGTNAWNVIGRNPDEGLHFSNMYKFDIVSVPSSTSTDFVHYNKIPLPKSIYTEIFIENTEKLTKLSSSLLVKISNRNDIFKKIIIDNGADIIDFSELEEPTKYVDTSIYYQFNTYGIHKIEYVLKDEYAGIMPEGMIPSATYTFKEITLPKGIYKIESRAFNDLFSKINKLNIPDTVTEVENCAIACTNISSEVEDFLLSINPSSVCNNCK